LSFAEVDATTRFTLDVDPETAFPLGFVAQTPHYVLIQIVHIYALVASDGLESEPFTWLPLALSNAAESRP